MLSDTTYGLPDNVHVVFVVIGPPTSVFEYSFAETYRGLTPSPNKKKLANNNVNVNKSVLFTCFALLQEFASPDLTLSSVEYLILHSPKCMLNSTRIQDYPNNLTNNPIRTATTIAITAQMQRKISLRIKNAPTGTTTTKATPNTFFHGYRYHS
jgi:hypothetical protein